MLLIEVLRGCLQSPEANAVNFPKAKALVIPVTLSTTLIQLYTTRS
jgi:hypothetical protein